MDAFAWLIDPLPVRKFEQEFYERQLCLIRRPHTRYYADLLDISDLDTVLGTHRVRRPEINLVRGEATLDPGTYTDAAGRVDPVAVARCFDGGATVIFSQLHRRVPALARFCTALGRIFGARMQTNIYLTPPGAQGFRPHWDTHDVFVLQLSGTKAWSIYDRPVELPLKGQAFDKERDQPGPLTEQFLLEPGHLAYVPRGLMHSATSTTEASLHITLGLMAFTWTDFLLESVAGAALKDASLRQNLPAGFTGDTMSVEQKARLYREKLAVLETQLEPAEVWRHFTDEARSANTPLYTDILETRLRSDGLEMNTRLQRRRDLQTDVECGAEHCVILMRDQEICLPLRVRPAVEFALSGEVFAVQDLPDCLDDDGKITLAERLVKDGVLCRMPVSAPAGT